ncbi:transferase family-domain-containing protein, partial [Biscogniauxia marginata]
LSDLDTVSPNVLVSSFLVYKLHPDQDIQLIIESLQHGLAQAAEQLPTLAAKLHFDNNGKPMRQMTPGSLELKVRKFEFGDHKSYDQLAAKSFSPYDFDQSTLLPVEAYDNINERNVLLAQLSFIPGGLIFALGFNHVASDGGGRNLALTLISKCSKAYMERDPASRSQFDYQREKFAAPLELLALPKEQLRTRVKDYQIIEMSTAPNKTKAPKTTSTANAAKGLIYRIEGANVKRLKDMCKSLKGIPYVSTYDCVAGLLWKSLMRVRAELKPHLKPRESRLLHPVDLRYRTESGISRNYFGNAVTVASAGPVQMADLLSSDGLSLAASSIRQSIENTTLGSIAHATALGRMMMPTEKLHFMPSGGLLEEGLMLSTWYFMNTADYDFGVGPPDSIRCSAVPAPGFAFLFPDCRRQQGSRVYDFYVTLQEAEQDMLSKDKEFRTWFSIL